MVINKPQSNLESCKVDQQEQDENVGIEGYSECPAFKQRCLTDCIIPFSPPVYQILTKVSLKAKECVYHMYTFFCTLKYKKKIYGR